MTGPVGGIDWPQAYIESHNRIAGMLRGIRRHGERSKTCLKVLINAASTLTSCAPAAISAPSAEHASSLAELAGAALAAQGVVSGGQGLDRRLDAQFVSYLARRSSDWGGQLAPALMAASDGDLQPLLRGGTVSELKAGAEAGRPADSAWLGDPANSIERAAALLAELNAAARPRPTTAHRVRAKALDELIASTVPTPSAHISAHAFAVHDLTGVYGCGGSSMMRDAMLRLVASHPAHKGATLQASKVAALLSDALGSRAKMALLDCILLALGPWDDDPSVHIPRARDSALILLLLDADAVEHGNPTEAALPDASAPESSPSPEQEPDQTAIHGRDAGVDGVHLSIDEMAEEAERAVVAAIAERQRRYQRATDMGSLPDALETIRDAADDDDHEQAWALLQDIARRHHDADPSDLVLVSSNLPSPTSRMKDEDFGELGDACFTILSPVPSQAAAAIDRVAPRLLNVDDRGVEHPDSDAAAASDEYTANFLFDTLWCDSAAQVTLDTKGAMTPQMARTMISILIDALVQDRVPALITGWVPGLNDAMTPWNDD